MDANILAQGIELMLYGMSTVVVFLSLLIVATMVMSWCVGRFFSEPEPAVVAKSSAGAAPDTQLVAAITAAIHRYRSGNT